MQKKFNSIINSAPAFIIKYWLVFTLFFELARVAFICFNYDLSSGLPAKEFFAVLYHGLRMDLSMAAYISVPVGLLFLFRRFLSNKVLKTAIIIYTTIISSLIIIIVISDVLLFRAWGNRIDATPLKYLSNPAELYASISHLPLLIISVIIVIILAILFVILKKLIHKGINFKHQNFVEIPILLLVIGAFIIPIRGGFQLAPLNQSSVFFSNNNFANQAAINAAWNLMYSLNQNENNKSNPYIVSDNIDAVAAVDSLYSRKGKTQYFLKTKTPNVIIITWESFTAKVIDEVKEGKEIVPGYNKLKNEGLYFPNIYAAGDRTDKGIVAVLSGYPAFALTSIVKIPKKASSLPIISKEFLNHGYSTSFYYGGEPEFANMKAYLMQGGFNNFITINDFKKEDLNSKWGAHDGVVANKIKDDLGNLKRPFFVNWLTLSSHEPFEVPGPPSFSGSDDESMFSNSLHYTDSIIYNFVQYGKTQPWWDNTLIVIVPDHGARLPRTKKIIDNFKVSILFLGGALKERGVVINKIGSQNDLASTLLNQLSFDASKFKWSKNLLDSSINEWAYFAFNNACGFVGSNGYFIYDNLGNRVIESSGDKSENEINTALKYQQYLYEDYLRR